MVSAVLYRQTGQRRVINRRVLANTYVPPRPLHEFDADLDKASREIMGLLAEVHAECLS